MVRFYDEQELARRLGVDREDFHRRIKQIIIKDFKKELMEIGIRNPDIGLDENDNIYLSDPRDHSNVIPTNLNISAYI